MRNERAAPRWHAAWLSVGWMLVFTVMYLSLARSVPQIDLPSGDKLEHLIAYGTLMLWFSQVYVVARARIALTLALALLGIGLEFAQSFTDYRTFDSLDMLANVTGVAAGWLLSPPRTWNVLARLESFYSR